MAKTYTLTATASRGGVLSHFAADWNNHYNQGDNRMRCGQVGVYYYAVYYMFNATTLAHLRSLPSSAITSVTLTLPITSLGNGMPSGSSDQLPIRAKATNGTGSDSGSAAWQSTGSNLGFIRGTVSNNKLTVTMEKTIPQYGYTMGPAKPGVTFVELGTSAVLTVVTTEVDLTLSYNANGGTGGPSAQSAVGTPSATLTVASSSSNPTRASSSASLAVTLNANGGSVSPASVSATRTTAYSFSKWNTKADGSGTNYSPGASITISANTTLYAIWTSSTTTGAVTLPTPSRTGYTFDGWFTAASGGTRVGGGGSSYTPSAVITLYAHWTAYTYAVTYNKNTTDTVSNLPSAQTKTYGVDLTLSSTKPTRTGYTFAGWATSASGAVAYAAGAKYTANAAVTLYAVWTANKATLSSVTSSVEIGKTNGGTASWNIPNSAYTYKLELSLSGATTVSYTIAANTGSKTFTIPNSWLSALSNTTSATATATLTTYSGSTSLGTSTKTFTVTVASGVKPTISSFTASHYAANATVSGWGTYTQGYSQANLSVSATAGTGASISSIAFSGPGVNQTGTSTTVRSAVFDSSGSKTFTVTVTDSRGRSASATVSVTVYPYASPTVSSIAVGRAKADGTADNGAGTYLSATPYYTISSVNGKNSITAQTLAYRLHGTSTNLGSKTCANGTTYKPTGTMWAVAIASAYDVIVTVKDALGNQTVFTTTLPSASGLWYGRGNDRLGLGDVPEGPGFWSAWDAHFKGVVDITPRRCYGSLINEGWYRVCAISFNSYGEAIGASGGILRFAITDSYATYPNDAHTITLLLAHNKVTFVDEASAANGYLEIDKIRYTFTGASPYNGYVDIHYLGRGGTTYVGIIFDYIGIGLNRQARVSAQTLQSVAASPSGETVFAEYTFTENTESNGTMTPNSGVSVAEVEVKRAGRAVYIRFSATAAISANTQTTLGTISGVPLPDQPIRWLAGGGAHAYYAASPVYAILGANGNIDVYSPSAIGSVNITLSYIV